MSEPKRAGLMELLQTTTGCQFVIPVYQRNYTWRADQEVKQYLSDLTHVLKGDYKNHFLGIMIYLEKSIDFSTRELSIIDGQQRLTTIFLTIYAVKQMFKEAGEEDKVRQLEGQYLTNPFHTDRIKYKLKPLVADDDVYRCIVEDRISDISAPNSAVLKNYYYISEYLTSLVASGFSANDILMALNKLYVVCVPITENDNAQKIFESINATGVKLTAADLIRNYLLMNLDSNTQDKFYANYWKRIEDNVSSDSNELEMFFRMFLAVKKFELVPKNAVYRSFVDWTTQEQIKTEELFKDLLEYAKIFNFINKTPIKELKKELQTPLTDYRKINSDIPMSIVLEFCRLYRNKIIDAETFSSLVQSINAYLIRRSLCDINSQNISKLFPTILKRIIDKCSSDYSTIVAVLNQEMVGNNVDTSGSYMPTDEQMHELLYNASVYKRPALRIVFDRLELNDNPAPVDLTHLSVEHLMPQTATDEWLAELNTDEETYNASLHRLGNLTLAAKVDNSKMSNLMWDYKNEVLKSTAHLKMNMELIPIKRWTLKEIDVRTEELIKRICQAFPYPAVSPVIKAEDEIVDEKTARELTVLTMFPNDGFVEIRKNNLYRDGIGTTGYVLFASKMYPEGDKEKYWFGYRAGRFEPLVTCAELNAVFICRSNNVLILKIPKEIIDDHLDAFNFTAGDDGTPEYYHLVFHKNADGKVTLLLSKPTLKRLDVTNYVVDEI